jgi:uncharacterized protein YpbB|tara:strand:+ start:334 stop:627 length:294 start_codon:yes stop_codon:yes gene_type:complete
MSKASLLLTQLKRKEVKSIIESLHGSKNGMGGTLKQIMDHLGEAQDRVNWLLKTGMGESNHEITEKDIKEVKRVEKDIGRLSNILRRLEKRIIKEGV